MQPIHVRRYEKLTEWAGTIEPEDRGWILFVASDGKPSLWVRDGESRDGDKTESSYRPA